MFRPFYILIILLFSFASLHSQNDAKLIVDSIVIEGNKRTKNRILLREMTFGVGDSIPLSTLSIVLEQNRNRLLNTNLFLSCKMNINRWAEDNHATVVIKVIENWYLYPIPIFELADRNFNVWWSEFKRDLRRTNYGMRLTFNNSTGRRDPLSAHVQLGYTPKYSFSYSIPYINKKQTMGFSISYFKAFNREVGYATDSNRISFYKDKQRFLLNRTNISAGISHSPGLYFSQGASAGYVNNTVDTFVVNNLNRDYYLDNRTNQQYFWISYAATIDRRDIRAYPLNGYFLSMGMSKNGLFKSDDINALDFSIRYVQYISFTPKLSLEVNTRLKAALIRQPQPYTNLRGLGYGGDFLRGYELYVVDGMDFAYSKNSLRFQILNKEFDLHKWTKMKLVQNWLTLPFKSYFTFNFDIGYANNPYARPTNAFANRPLFGGGIGLDLIAYYNMIWKVEFSMNHTGQKGLYFNYSLGF
jgi:outer membrane protein assembly factor BamA